MEIRRQNCLEKVSQRHAERQGIEDTITGLRGVVLQKELDGEQLRSELSVARAQLQRAREDIEGKRQQVAELQHATGKDQLEA